MSVHDAIPSSLRGEFPVLHQEVEGRPLVYLDNAATTQKPRCVISAMTRFYESDNANVHRAEHELARRATAAFEAARERMARFLGADGADEIVFTRGTTEAINLVAASWGQDRLRPGDEILLTPMEHHSNLVPWQRIAARTGAVLRFLPLDAEGGGLDLARAPEFLGARTRMLALTHVSNVLGCVNPVAGLCAEASRRGVVTLVDAAQSAGHMPVDVRAIGCDFLALSGHKMCGPTGIGVLYGRRARLHALEPWQGGGEMIESVTLERSTYAPPPQRFEAGTPDISGAVGLHAAADFLDRLGRDAIHRHVSALATEAARHLREIPGIRVVGPVAGRTGVVSFSAGSVHAHDLATVANAQGVAIRAGHHCAQPLLRELGVESLARASFHCYNTGGEIERLVDAVRAGLRLLS